MDPSCAKTLPSGSSPRVGEKIQTKPTKRAAQHQVERVPQAWELPAPPMPMIDATTFAGIGIFIQQVLTQTEDLFTPLGTISNAASNDVQLIMEDEKAT